MFFVVFSYKYAMVLVSCCVFWSQLKLMILWRGIENSVSRNLTPFILVLKCWLCVCVRLSWLYARVHFRMYTACGILYVCRVCPYISPCAYIWVKFVLRRLGWGKQTEHVRIRPTQWAIETLFYFVLVQRKKKQNFFFNIHVDMLVYYNIITHSHMHNTYRR